MKFILSALLFLTVFTAAFGQSSAKTDDALLLEYYQNQRYADASDYLKRTFPEPVTDVKILARLAYTSQMAGRLPEADDYYQRIYATDTTNTAVLFNLGGINARRGNDVKAIVYYKKILTRDSTNFNVYKQLATLSQNSGAFVNAINYFLKANKLNPTEPDVAYDLTTLFLNLKVYGRADTVITVALQADTANLLLLSAKAQTNYRLLKFPETIMVCNKLVQAGDVTTPVVSMLGTSYYSVKNYRKCIEAFTMLEQSQTSNETSYYYTAMSHKALGEQKEAIAYLEKAIKEATTGNTNSYYSEMGDSYDTLHQPKNALGAYRKSLLYGVKPITYYVLANLYDTELKSKPLALKYYKKYLESSPEEKQKTYTDYSKNRVKELAR